jgi:hypothetical protein
MRNAKRNVLAILPLSLILIYPFLPSVSPSLSLPLSLLCTLIPCRMSESWRPAALPVDGRKEEVVVGEGVVVQRR